MFSVTQLLDVAAPDRRRVLAAVRAAAEHSAAPRWVIEPIEEHGPLRRPEQKGVKLDISSAPLDDAAFIGALNVGYDLGGPAVYSDEAPLSAFQLA